MGSPPGLRDPPYPPHFGHLLPSGPPHAGCGVSRFPPRFFLDVGSVSPTEPTPLHPTPHPPPLSQRPPHPSRGLPKTSAVGGTAAITSHRGVAGDNEMGVQPRPRSRPSAWGGGGGSYFGVQGCSPIHPPLPGATCHRFAAPMAAPVSPNSAGNESPGEGEPPTWGGCCFGVGGVHTPNPLE